MNRRNILSLSVITALGLSVLPNTVMARHQSLKHQLVGTWTLVSWEQDVANGPKFQRFGTNPKGVTVFDANGRVFSMYARPDLPNIASKNPSTPTPEEAEAIVGGSIGYFGTYTVDEATKVVTLKIEASSFPNLVGADQKSLLGIDQTRAVTSISPTELKMQNATAVSGGAIYYVFKRAK
jgi:hypothetical protein